MDIPSDTRAEVLVARFESDNEARERLAQAEVARSSRVESSA